MAEQRLVKRLRRRVALRFGIDEATQLGFTEDISPEGLFIKTPNVAAPGSRLTVTLILQDDWTVTFVGRVMWAKKVPAQMIRVVKKSGLGLKIERFIEGEERYRKLCEKTLTPA